MPKNILLVDDDENILKSYQLLLESQGHTVNIATNPYAALQLMKEKDFNLAILDYNLPYMTGTQLGHLLKKIKKTTPIMFISGNPEIHEIAKKVKYDVFTVLSKPINPDLLIQSVDINLSGAHTSLSSHNKVTVKEQNQVTRLINNINKLFLPAINHVIQ